MNRILLDKRIFLLASVFILSYILLTNASLADNADCENLTETKCKTYNSDRSISNWQDGCYWITCNQGTAPVNGICDNPVAGYCSNSIPATANIGGNLVKDKDFNVEEGNNDVVGDVEAEVTTNGPCGLPIAIAEPTTPPVLTAEAPTISTQVPSEPSFVQLITNAWNLIMHNNTPANYPAYNPTYPVPTNPYPYTTNPTTLPS